MYKRFIHRIFLSSVICASLGTYTLWASQSPVTVTHFIEAIKTNSKATLKKLVTEHRRLVNKVDPITGQTPLQYAAAQKNDPEFVAILLSAGASDLGGHALQLAEVRTQRGQNNQAVRELLQQKQRPTQLIAASSAGSSGSSSQAKQSTSSTDELVSVVVHPKKQVAVPRDFIEAVRLVNKVSLSEEQNSENRKQLKALLTHNRNLVNMQDSYGNTLLSYAARNGLLGSVKDLVEQFGAQVNLADSKKSTPLQWALVNGHDAVISYLTQHGGLVNAKIDIMLEPAGFARLLMQDFHALDQQKADKVAQFVTPLPDKELHLSLAYMSVPLEYTDDPALYELYAQSIFGELIRGLKSIKSLKEEFTQISHSFRYASLDILGNFVALSLRAPAEYDDLIKEIYDRIARVLPSAEKTYPEEKPPHISFAKAIKTPAGKIVDLTDLKVPQSFIDVLKHHTKKNFSQGSTDTLNLTVSMRVPTRNKPNYRDYSQTF
jgi:ankyrin repeat protein